MTDQATRPPQARSRLLYIGVFVAGLGLLVALILAVPPAETFLTYYGTLTAFIAAYRYAALCLFALLYIVIIAFCLPGNVMMALMSGVLFGGLTGGLISVASSTLGGSLFFIAARAGVSGVVKDTTPARLARFAEGFRRDGFFYLLFLRLTPIFPFFVVNIAAALCGLSLVTFVIATAIGIAPVIFAYSYTMAGLEHVIAKQAHDFVTCKASGQIECPPFSFHAFIGTDLIVPLSVLGCLAILPVIVKRIMRQNKKAVPDG